MAAKPTDERKALHEAGHAVVGIAVSLKALRLFMDPLPGTGTGMGTTRGAGVDFVPPPDGTFVLERPVQERRQICLRLIAQFAAGYVAERVFDGEIYDPWIDGPDGDKADILNKAVWGVATPDDTGIIDGSVDFETWAKRPMVDELIAEGEALAERLLRELTGPVRDIADIARRIRRVAGPNLHQIVEREMARKGIPKVI